MKEKKRREIHLFLPAVKSSYWSEINIVRIALATYVSCVPENHQCCYVNIYMILLMHNGKALFLLKRVSFVKYFCITVTNLCYHKQINKLCYWLLVQSYLCLNENEFYGYFCLIMVNISWEKESKINKKKNWI